MDEAETFYENSFEHADDAAGWYGITVEMFENDPAPGSGERCLGIGGGCIQPTATFTLPESESGGLYKLSCWGKVDEPYHGGSIRLVGGHRPVEFEIREHDWTFYETDTPVYCSAGKSMTIEILIGGYVADFMKLDAVRIIRE